MTEGAAIKVAPVSMALELGFRNIGHDVIFELAGRFQIVRTAMATVLGTNIMLDEHGIGRRLGSKAAGVFAVLLAAAVRAGTVPGTAVAARTLAALMDLLEFVLQQRQPSPQSGGFRS